MKDWRNTILKVLARRNGRATLPDIYARLESMNVLSSHETRKTRYGGRPAYQNTTRSIIHDLYRAGYLRQLSRGHYAINPKGRLTASRNRKSRTFEWKPTSMSEADVDARKRRELLDKKVEEGLRQDKTAYFRKRNAGIIASRKEHDNYTCQACGLRLVINDVHIIDCHHTRPFARASGIRITSMKDLVCLCPTCHRIAHTA